MMYWLSCCALQGSEHCEATNQRFIDDFGPQILLRKMKCGSQSLRTYLTMEFIQRLVPHAFHTNWYSFSEQQILLQ